MSGKLEVSSSRFQQGEEFDHQAIGAGDKVQQRINAQVESFVAEVALRVLKYIESERLGKTESCGIKLPGEREFKLYNLAEDGQSFQIRNNRFWTSSPGQVAWPRVVDIRVSLSKDQEGETTCRVTRINYPIISFFKVDKPENARNQIQTIEIRTPLTPAQLKLACDNLNNPNSD